MMILSHRSISAIQLTSFCLIATDFLHSLYPLAILCTLETYCEFSKFGRLRGEQQGFINDLGKDFCVHKSA